MDHFQLHKDQFNRLFPFHLLIGRDLLIHSAGRSLLKLFPEIIGFHLQDIFLIKRPGLNHIHIDILKNIDELIILQSLSKDNIMLRGQFEYLENEAQLLFAGTPWFASMDEVKLQQLKLNDFAISDPMIDLLHVLKTQEIASAEVRELLEHSQKQSAQSFASSKRLSQLITNLQTGVLLEDENRKIVLVNQIFCNLFSIPVDPNLMIGWDCSDSAQQSKPFFKDPEQFVSRIDTILENKKTVLREILELVDGRVFERDYIPMFIDDIYKGHLWNYTDVTERRNQENLLKKSEEKYRGIISNINLGLVEVDLEENIQYVNQSFCAISGYKEEELIGKKASDILIMDDPAYEAIMEEKNKQRISGVSDAYELPVTIKGGTKKWWMVSGAPLFNDDGEVIGSIGIHLDITQQKNLEQQLREAKILAERSAEAKEVFLANMSHEIRTPLSGIYGMMQLLDGTRLNIEQKTYIQFIDKAIENLQTVINDILDFSKINAGMIEIDANDFSLKEEIEAIYQLTLPKAKSKELELEIQYDINLSKFYAGDAHRIGQIITNLLGNAIKFTEHGTVIIASKLLKFNDEQDLVEIRIMDTGIGIDADYLPHLFDKFSQEESGRAKKYGGTGLGMSISKQLVELMGGSIRVESQKNVGTNVIVELPLLRRSSRAVIESYALMPGLLQGQKILIAEDNDINATVIKSLLVKEGAEVTLVNNGRELIELARDQKYDLIISDLQMPIMTGIEAVEWVRINLPPQQRMIALTANAFAAEKEKCLKAGFNDVIYKPFKKENLIKVCAGYTSLQLEQSENGDDVIDTLYNLDNLSDMVDHNQEQIRYLVHQFLEETPGKIDLMRHALVENNLNTIRKTAHYLSSSIHHMEVSSLYDLTSKIEHTKLTKINNSLETDVLKMCDVLDRVIIQLRRDYP